MTRKIAILLLLTLLPISAQAETKKYIGKVLSGSRYAWIYKDLNRGNIEIKNGKPVLIRSGTKIILKSQKIYKNDKGTIFVKIGFLNETQLMEMRKNVRLFFPDRKVKMNELSRDFAYINIRNTSFININNVVKTESIYKNEIEQELIKTIKMNDLNKIENYKQKYKNNKYAKEFVAIADKKIIDLKRKKEKSLFDKKLAQAKRSNNYANLVSLYSEFYGKDQNRKAGRKYYPSQAKIDEMANAAYEITKNLNTLKGYKSYINDFKGANLNKISAKSNIYNIISKQNIISAYNWYIRKYPEVKESRTALQNLYNIAFSTVKSINTIEAYNDFIIAYPYAKQIPEAKRKAYKLEAESYSGWFSDDEKNSRALLVRSKQLARKMRDAKSSERDGYRLVIDRMNQLLQDKYPAEEATLRHLESEEFKDFYHDLKKSLDSINSTLERIERNTSDLRDTLKTQSQMVDQHFRKAAQSKEMANQYTKQHRHWERYLKDQGI